MGAGLWLENKAVKTSSGYKWDFKQNDTDDEYTIDIYGGSAGIGYFFVDEYLVTGNPEYLTYARGAARDIRSRLSEYNGDTGLYSGLAGAGYFFAVLYEATQEKEFLDDAEYVSSQMGSTYYGTDIIGGAAGTELFYLELYNITRKSSYLDSAKACGDYLISKAKAEGGGYKWEPSDGFGKVYTGFAHGPAGVSYSLAVLYEWTGDTKYLDYSKGGAQWLMDKAVADGDTYKWYRREPDLTTEFNNQWCDGPPGVSLTFLKLYSLTSDQRYMTYAKKGLDYTIKTGQYIYWSPCLCHGSGGNAMSFVDLYKATGNVSYLYYSNLSNKDIESKAVEQLGGYYWETSGFAGVEDPTYMGDVAGIGDFFLYSQTRGRIGRFGLIDRKAPWAPELACVPSTIDTQIQPVLVGLDGTGLQSYTSAQLGVQKVEKNGVRVYYKPAKSVLANQMLSFTYKGLQLEYQLTNLSLGGFQMVLGSSWSDFPGVTSQWINLDSDNSTLLLPTDREKFPITQYNDSPWDNLTAFMYYGMQFHEPVDMGIKHDLLGGNLGDISNRWFVEGQADYMVFVVTQAYGDPEATRSQIPFLLDKVVTVRKSQSTLNVIDSGCWWTATGARSDTEGACYAASTYVFAYLTEKYGTDITRKINNKLRTYPPSQINSDKITSVIKDLTGEDIKPMLLAVPLDNVIDYYDKGKMFNYCGGVGPTTTTTTTPSTSSSTTTSSTTSSTRASTTTSSTTTTTFPICYFTSSRSLVAGDNSIDFQTPHNYPDNMNCFSGIYRCPSGYSAKVYVKYDTEPVYDLFIVYNYDSGSSLNSSGNSSGFVWLTPSGFNAVRLRFMSDYSVNNWGIDVDKINCFSSVTTTTSTSTTLPVTTSSTTSSTSSTTTRTSSTTSLPVTSSSSTSTITSTTTTIPVCPSTSSMNLAAGDNLVDFQTPHGYPDSMDCYSGVYKCPASYSAKVYVKYDTEQYYDLFYVYDNVSGSFRNWSGNSSGFVWLTPSGVNAVKFRFTSDYSMGFWGVDVDKVNCYVSGTTTTSSTSTTAVPSTTTTSQTSTTTTKPPATTTTTASTTSSSTSPSSTSTTTTSSTSTTGTWPCKMPGDYPPCGEVTVDEIVGAISLWAQGKLSLNDVMNLINAWAFNGYYFFQQ